MVDLFRLVPHTEHPHGLTDREFDALFTPDKPVIFNFHGYPVADPPAHLPSARNHDNIHVRGYKEKGNINTPLELAIRNQVDRFTWRSMRSTAFLDCRVRRHLKEWLKGQIIESINYAYTEGIDKPEIRNWKWPSDQLP